MVRKLKINFSDKLSKSVGAVRKMPVVKGLFLVAMLGSIAFLIYFLLWGFNVIEDPVLTQGAKDSNKRVF